MLKQTVSKSKPLAVTVALAVALAVTVALALNPIPSAIEDLYRANTYTATYI